MKILLVDDDAFLRDMYVTKFTQNGDVVVGVQDGDQALKMMKNDSFDVIILDMVMPKMSGVDLLRAIKADDSNKNTKCIILSNQSEELDIKFATELGAVGYIIKAELIPSEVVKKVHTLVS